MFMSHTAKRSPRKKKKEENTPYKFTNACYPPLTYKEARMLNRIVQSWKIIFNQYNLQALWHQMILQTYVPLRLYFDGAMHEIYYESQIPVTKRSFELRISNIQSSYLIHSCMQEVKTSNSPVVTVICDPLQILSKILSKFENLFKVDISPLYIYIHNIQREKNKTRSHSENQWNRLNKTPLLVQNLPHPTRVCLWIKLKLLFLKLKNYSLWCGVNISTIFFYLDTWRTRISNFFA